MKHYRYLRRQALAKRVVLIWLVIIMYYESRPTRGKGRKAWDKYIEKYGKRPHSISYTNRYLDEYKGWLCYHLAKDGVSQKLGQYAAADTDHFFFSSEL